MPDRQFGDSSATTLAPRAGSMPGSSTGAGGMDGNALWQMLQSADGRNALEALLSAGQGASNAVATTVTAPVDAIAWLLQQAGVDVGSTPIGGEAWARRVGLLRDPANPLAGAVGEGLGNAASVGLLGLRGFKLPR